jgi:hypothetical protein
LDSFEAEAKRSWFTLRDSLRATTRGGRLWIPAVVTPVEGSVRIFTSEGAVEFRPRRLRWIASNSFVVAGVGKGAKIRRSYLRFKTPGEASRVATIIKQNSAILEEPLVPVEEFPVQVRLLFSAGYLAVQLTAVLVRLVVGLFILLVLFHFGPLGLTIETILLLAYVGLPIWAAFVRARRTTEGWIRLEGGKIVVRTTLDWTRVLPKLIQWKSAKVIILEGTGTKHELSFPSTQDLTQAITRIRSAFPQVQEILSKTYQPGVDAAHA